MAKLHDQEEQHELSRKALAKVTKENFGEKIQENDFVENVVMDDIIDHMNTDQ